MGWTTYKGKYVLDRVAVPRNQPGQSAQTITIGRDFQRRTRFTFSVPCVIFERDFQLTGQSDMLDLRNFWRAHKGAFMPLWVPSWTRDFILTESHASGTSSLKIKRTNIQLMDGRIRHIFIPDISFFAKITNITDNATYYTLSLSAAIPAGITQDTMVCMLHYCRFATDDFVLRHVKSAGVWKVTLQFHEIPSETPA